MPTTMARVATAGVPMAQRQARAALRAVVELVVMVGEEALTAAQWVESALQLRLTAGRETPVAAAASLTLVALLALLLWELCAHIRRRCEYI